VIGDWYVRNTPVLSREQERKGVKKLDVSEEPPFLVDVRVNGIYYAEALVDYGCLSYATVNGTLARTLNLPRIKIRPRRLDGVVANQGRITHVTYFDADIHGHQQGTTFAYIIED
jgi:hypothetical protein